MKSIILYGLIVHPSAPQSTRHDIHRVRVNQELAVDIRTEVVDGDCLEALDKAKPESNEAVLNTLDIK